MRSSKNNFKYFIHVTDRRKIYSYYFNIIRRSNLKKNTVPNLCKESAKCVRKNSE